MEAVRFFGVPYATPSHPVSSRIKEEKTRVKDPDGSYRLQVIGSYDLVELIQSFRESSEYNEILRRALSGDPIAAARLEVTEAYQEVNPLFAGMSLRELADANNAARDFFETKGGEAYFHMPFDKWLGCYDLVDVPDDKPASTIPEEVKPNGEK